MIKTTAQQGRGQSGTNNPANTEVREGRGDVPGAQAETTEEQISTLQTMENLPLEQLDKF